MSISTSTSSVVERASKEISRRMHSLGFKTSSPSPSPSPSSSKSDKSKLVLSESDKLNGNNELEDQAGGAGASASSEDGVVLRRKKPVSHAAKQPAARASMSSIIKGSVMDKVTHVFNNGVSSMGNANNSKTSGLATASNPKPSEGGGKEAKKAAAEAENSPGNDGKPGPPASGINIPKGELYVCIFRDNGKRNALRDGKDEYSLG